MSIPKSSIAEKLLVDRKPPAKEKSPEDFRVWNAFRKGNEQAFIFIYETHFNKLYAYGMRISGDGYLVEDAIQELFIDLKNNRSRIKATDSIKFYLFKCLKRKLQREASKWTYKRKGLEADLPFNFIVSHEQHLIDQQIKIEQMDLLNQAIQKLSPRQKEVIYYFFYEELNYVQIQELMNFENIKSARNILYKALDFLKTALNQ